jgi:hypothetical protein
LGCSFLSHHIVLSIAAISKTTVATAFL